MSSHSTESHFEWSQYFEDTYDSFLADWALANDSQEQAERKINSGCSGSFFSKTELIVALSGQAHERVTLIPGDRNIICF